MQSLERGLSVIRALGRPGNGMTVSEVARATRLTRAAARRFLLTLVDLGYVRADGGRYALTARVLELGYSFLSSLSLPELAQPHLRSLVQAVDESSSVSVLDGEDVVYVAREPARRIMAVTIAVGTRFPAFCTSMGRVLLAAMEPDQLDTFLAGASLPALTPHTITEPAALRAELARVHTRGWALVDQELELGLRSVAVAIRDPHGRVLAAANLSAHASRTTLSALRQQLLPRLRATAAEIERDLAFGAQRA